MMNLDASTITDADRARFAAKTLPYPDTGCTLWTGAVSRDGYGHFRLGKHVCGAHRFAYIAVRGLNPGSLVVRHRCHTRRCVNPDHLEIGTKADNSEDMVEAGRSRHKLSDEDVAYCIGLKMLSYTQAEIAAVLGVCQQTVSKILTGKTRRGAVTRELDRVTAQIERDEVA